MTYAQKDYTQTLGNGENTIATSGALLTAFSNLLERFDESADPATLNAAFVEDNVYLYKTDDVRDRLALSSISAYDPNISIFDVGEGVPPHVNAIVRFDYDSVLTGGRVSTYALVFDNVAGTVVDSYDGKVKSWDVYGGPVEWFAYKQFEAVEISPLKPAVQPVKASPDMYTISHALRGYLKLEDAEASVNSTIDVQPGDYYVYDASEGADFVNVTATIDQPSAWIDVSENGTDNEQETAESVDGEKIEVKVKPTDPLAWQKTYTPYLGPVEMVVVNDSVVIDLADEHESRKVNAGDTAKIVGEFVNGFVTYARTETSAERGNWYGIPVTNLRREGEDDEAALDAALDHYLNSDDETLQLELGDDRPSLKEKAIKAGATVDGKIEKVFKRKWK